MKCHSMLVVVAAALTVAVGKADAPQSVVEIIENETGGRFKTLHKDTKHVYYVNAQSVVDSAVIKEALHNMSKFINTPIDYSTGEFKFPNPTIKGELTLYVINDPAMPISLVAPEGRWAFVNVHPLSQGRGEKPTFQKARVMKEMARIGCMLLGGIGSSYRGNLLSHLRTPEDLDRFESDILPVDGMMRSAMYLKQIGVMPYRMVSYRKACKEGWAPAPTNEYQQAIWDKVHAIPKKPMKIEFDPKKGR